MNIDSMPLNHRRTSTAKGGDGSGEKLYSIVEIFESLKGEGTQAGIPMTFVRFAGCNRSCNFCDTQFNRPGFRATKRQIAQLIKNTRPAWVVFTGGEPLMQLDDDLVAEISKSNRTTKYAIETNGSLYKDVLERMDYINLSPKAPPPHFRSILRAEAEATANYHRSFLHFWIAPSVVDAARRGYITIDEIRYSMDSEMGKFFEPLDCPSECITFSPLFDAPAGLPDNWKVGDGFGNLKGSPNESALRTCVELIQHFRHKNARLSIQCHKMIGVR